MRVLLLSATLSLLGLPLLDADRRTNAGAGTAAVNARHHEQARNQLLTPEERVDIESRRLALEASR